MPESPAYRFGDGARMAERLRAKEEAALSACTAVNVDSGALPWVVNKHAVAGAPVALREAAAILGLDPVPVVRWQRVRRPADVNTTPGLMKGVSPTTAGYVRYVEPGVVNLRADDYPYDAEWTAEDRDHLVEVIGHECGHLLDHQGVAEDVYVADYVEDDLHVEAAANLVRDTIADRLRVAVRRAEIRRQLGLQADGESTAEA